MGSRRLDSRGPRFSGIGIAQKLESCSSDVLRLHENLIGKQESLTWFNPHCHAPYLLDFG